VRLVKYATAGNKQSNVEARGGTTVNFMGCSISDSVEWNGLFACHEGTHIEAKDTAFQGNRLCGVIVLRKASVRLDNCTVAGDQQSNLDAEGRTTVNPTSCTVADRLDRRLLRL
jgi:hypothetical protein